MSSHRSASLLLLSCLLISCSNLPRDPKQTLRRVQTQPMRVGLVEHPPWVIRTDGEPRGVEVDLVREFANGLGTTPEWHWGGSQEQMEALENYGLDLVIGGFTSRSPWKTYVGFTAPYFDETISVPGTSELDRVKHVMAAPPGENGFIKRLDEFLHQKRPSLASMLQQEASQNEIAR
jgi:polar amino acid transport system substrate-binding protein